MSPSLVILLLWSARKCRAEMQAHLASKAPVAGDNPFLAPMIARWSEAPQSLMGMFHDGENWQEITQGQFGQLVLQAAALLRRSGIGTGDVVLMILPHGVAAKAAFIAGMLIGAIPSFLPTPNARQEPALYWRQHRQIFAHTRPAAILSGAAWYGAVAEAAAGTGTKVIEAEFSAIAPLAEDACLPGGETTALLQHSSGTTGLKKGVMLSYDAICAQLAAYHAALDIDPAQSTRIASWLPLYHDMGLISSFLLPLWFGIPIISLDPFEWTMRPSLMFEAIETYRATHAWMPNFAFLHQIRTDRGNRIWDLSSVRALISCSEPCKPEAFDAFAIKFQTCSLKAKALQTCYAMAETVFAVTQSATGRPPRRLAVSRHAIQSLGTAAPSMREEENIVLLSNGKPLRGCEIAILREGRFAGEREIGVICITAPYLFTGYYNNPQATKAAFHGMWYNTGDLGFLDDGELFVAGRLKDVIIVNGKNLFAHDIEATISAVPGVKPGRAVALGIYDDDLGTEQLIAIAERDGPPDDDETLKSRINRAVMDEVGIACAAVSITNPGWLVKTTSGKMSRSENLKKYLQPS